MRKELSLFFGFALVFNACTVSQEIPKSYSNISMNEEGEMFITTPEGKEFPLLSSTPKYTLNNLTGNPIGTEKGILLDFNMSDFEGNIFYGFINYNDAKYPLPVYFKRDKSIDEGKVEIDITELSGRYDMIGWETSKKGVLGYRVTDNDGEFLYDGRLFFKGNGPFEVDDASIILGPFVNRLTPTGATISFRTLKPTICGVTCNGKTFKDNKPTEVHEIEIGGLSPNTNLDYTINFGEKELTFSFKTAPEPGSRTAFSFAYASDSRSGKGGGERDLKGVNYYMIKRIAAYASKENVAFSQFSGDLINGYLSDGEEQALQYFNWFRAIEPFAPYRPTYISMGNHEALNHRFTDGSEYGIAIDKFPFDTHSAEKLFADFVTNPSNGPKSEDGAVYDPSPKTTDFPPYDETVFSYTYDNVAVIVLNSDYWYAPSLAGAPYSSGGLHGYIMDNQLEFLRNEVEKFEKDPNIDHVFMTQHTPCFPNGGHVRDDMWYNGNNDFRPFVAGKPVAKGIIERRDEILDIIVNKSTKVRAIFTGDEHNYAKTEIGPETVIYPEEYALPKLELKRTIWQINNGSAGAPYYAQEQTPWTPKVSGFSTQNVVVLMDVNGKSLKMRVINPDTFDDVDELILVE